MRSIIGTLTFVAIVSTLGCIVMLAQQGRTSGVAVIETQVTGTTPPNQEIGSSVMGVSNALALKQQANEALASHRARAIKGLEAALAEVRKRDDVRSWCHVIERTETDISTLMFDSAPPPWPMLCWKGR